MGLGMKIMKNINGINGVALLQPRQRARGEAGLLCKASISVAKISLGSSSAKTPTWREKIQDGLLW